MSAIAAEDFPILERRRYRPVQVILHWLVVALIIEQYATSGAIKRTHAAVMAGQAPDPGDLLLHAIHNRAGMLITGLMALRLFLRWRVGPAWAATTLAARVAASAHAAFYGLIIAQGVTGFIAAYFWWPISAAHVVLFKALFALVVMHAIAALWHHLVRRDEVLAHMVPGLNPRSPSKAPGEAKDIVADLAWAPGYATMQKAFGGRPESKVRAAPRIIVATARGHGMAVRWIALAMGVTIVVFAGLFVGAAVWGPAAAPSVSNERGAATADGANRTLRIGRWTAVVTISQARQRSVVFTASIKDDQGLPPSGQPTAALSESGMGMKVAMTLEQSPPGTWRASADLPMAGAWSIILDLEGEQVSVPLNARSG